MEPTEENGSTNGVYKYGEFDPNEVIDDAVIYQQVGAAVKPQYPDEYQHA